MQQTSRTFHELENMGKKKLFGKVELSEQDFREVIELAKEGVASRGKITDLTQRMRKLSSMVDGLNLAYNKLYEQTKEFFRALKLAPKRVKEVFTEIFAKDREEREQALKLRQQAHDRSKKARRNDPVR